MRQELIKLLNHREKSRRHVGGRDHLLLQLQLLENASLRA